MVLLGDGTEIAIAPVPRKSKNSDDPPTPPPKPVQKKIILNCRVQEILDNSTLATSLAYLNPSHMTKYKLEHVRNCAEKMCELILQGVVCTCEVAYQKARKTIFGTYRWIH